MSISDAEYQRWLETSGNYRCALFRLTFLGNGGGSAAEMYAYLSNMPYISHPTDSLPNRCFEECVIEIPTFTRRMGEQLEGRSTQSYGDLILSNENVLDREQQQLDGGVRDAWLSMNWDGRQIKQWIGDPSWSFDDFRPVLDGALVDVFDPGGFKIGFKISDKAALLDRPVMTTLLGGTSPNAGDLMPLALGRILTNITPKLTDATNHIYRITAVDPGGLIEKLYVGGTPENPDVVYENGVALQSGMLAVTAVNIGTETQTSVSHGLVAGSRLGYVNTGSNPPSAPLAYLTDYWVSTAGLTVDDFRLADTLAHALAGTDTINLTALPAAGNPTFIARNWTPLPNTGSFQLVASPTGTITCTLPYGLGLGTGPALPYITAGGIIYYVLTSGLTNKPAISINAASLASFVAECPQSLGVYLTERTTFVDLFDRLVLSVGGWWGLNRAGELVFGRLDLPAPGSPVYSFIADDVAMRTLRLARRILPRATVKLRWGRNWTPQSTVAESVDELTRVTLATEWQEKTGSVTPGAWSTDPVNHLRATRPEPYETLLTIGAEAQTEADRLAALFQYPTGVWAFQTHQAAFRLEIGDPSYIEHPKFTGDDTVVGLEERIKGRSTVEFFAQLPDVYPTASLE